MTGYAKTAAAWIAGIALLFGAAALPSWAQAPTPITVYKSPTCGCCEQWIKHLQANGFKVSAKNVDEIAPIKLKYGVPPALMSCHTALVDGYVIEGHVPPATIRRLLRERPKVVGLTVPGMPQSAPGMDAAQGEPYDVLAFDANGRSTVYERH